MNLSFLPDLRHAVRTLRKSPGFTAITVLTLALSIGANSAIFSLVNAIIIQPLPYPAADRLVVVEHAAPGLDLAEADLSDGIYLHYREHNRVFDEVGMYNENVVNLEGDASPERVRVALVTRSLLSLLGATPVLGRLFTAEDEVPYTPGALTSVVLSHELWTRQYGGDPGIIGQTIELNSAPKQVVGIMEPGFDFPRTETEIWYPQGLDPASAGLAGFYYHTVARLKAGVSPERAEADLQRLIGGLPEAYPDAAAEIVERGGLRALVTPLEAEVIGDIGDSLWVLLGGVVSVLLIACANIANLVLIRAEHRQQEFAVRTALGARRADQVRYFLGESVLLSALGAALGLALAGAATRALRMLGPAGLPRLTEVGLDGWVLAYTGALAAVAALVFATVPLLPFRSRSLTPAFGAAGGRTTAGRDRMRARSVLVAGQVALGLTLLIASALLLQSLRRLKDVDPGFRPAGVLTLEIAMPAGPYPDYQSQARFWQRLLERVRGLAGVEAAGAVSGLPLVPLEAYYDAPIAIEGRPFGPAAATGGALTPSGGAAQRRGSDKASAPPPKPDRGAPMVTFKAVTPGYFDALRIPVVDGRTFRPGDRAGRENPVLMSAALAQRLFPNGGAVGDRVRRADAAEGRWLTIVGVVGSVPEESVAGEAIDVVYTPVIDGAAAYTYPGHMSLAVRTDLLPLSLAPIVRRIVRELDPAMPVANVRTLERIVANSMTRTSFAMLLLLVSAAVALFIGAVGIYGVVSYTVGQRTREIGVRIALGAPPARVGRMVLGQCAVVVVAGLAAGVALALTMSRVLQSLLFAVSPTDPGIYAGAAGLLLAVALLASYVPARRAARVDPMTAVRAE